MVNARLASPVPWAALLLACAALGQSRFEDDFSGLLAGWVETASGDFSERLVDIVPNGKLRLRAGTMGTRDDTVKYLGARARHAFDVGEGLCGRATLDWNDQANGSYLTAGVILAPEATDANPLRQRDWIAVEYVGVPPGKNARLRVRSSRKGRVSTLEDEGWPHQQRTGRKISRVSLRWRLSRESVAIWENGRLVLASRDVPSMERMFVYLQLSSHSNYRAREVYFDDVGLWAAHGADCEAGSPR